jgi:hypothetical protein
MKTPNRRRTGTPPSAQNGLRGLHFGVCCYRRAPSGLLQLLFIQSRKVNSRKSAYSIVRRTPPQNRKARSLAHPLSMTDSYRLWSWIDIRDREYSPAAVELDQTTHVSCVALHSPASGVATQGLVHTAGGVPSRARYPVRVAADSP